MFFRSPSQVLDNIWVVGDPRFPVFILKSEDEYILVEPGISGNSSLIEFHLKKMGIGLDGISCCVVLHEHYDHCMLLPWLACKNPGMRIFAPSGFKDLFKKNFPSFKKFDDFTSRKLKLKSASEFVDLEVEEYTEGKGPLGMEFIHVPGHSPSSYALLFDNVLFVSDALGYWGKEIECPLYFYRLSLYLDSIRKIGTLNAEVIITGHLSLFEGKEIVGRSLERAVDMRNYILSRGFKEADASKLFGEIYKGEFELYPPEVILSCSKYLIKRSYEEVKL